KDASLSFAHANSSNQCSQYFSLLPTLHRQNDAELRLAAQHSFVSFSRFFERIRLNHRTHAAQFGKVERVLGICRCSRGPALNRSTSTDQLYRCDLNGIECGADHHEFAVWTQTVDQLGHGFRAWGCRQNYPCAAELL